MGAVVDLGADRGAARKDALDELGRLGAADLLKVNEVILRRTDSPVALIPRLAGHLIAAGGKRLRPMLTLASAGLCGGYGDCTSGRKSTKMRSISCVAC